MTCYYIIRLLQMISSINFKADSNRFDRFLNKNKSDFVKKEFLYTNVVNVCGALQTTQAWNLS